MVYILKKACTILPACYLSGYRQVTYYAQQTQNGSRTISVNFQSACSRAFEYWRYSISENKS